MIIAFTETELTKINEISQKRNFKFEHGEKLLEGYNDDYALEIIGKDVSYILKLVKWNDYNTKENKHIIQYSIEITLFYNDKIIFTDYKYYKRFNNFIKKLNENIRKELK